MLVLQPVQFPAIGKKEFDFSGMNELVAVSLTHLQKHLARVHVPDQLILRVLLELARELQDELLEHERVEVLAQQVDQEPVPHLRPLHQHVHLLLQWKGKDEGNEYRGVWK